MRAPFSLCCLLLLSLGACIPPGERRDPARRGEGTLQGPGWRAGAQSRRSEELEALLGIPRELRGCGSEGTGQRPGRRGVLPTAGEKRSGTLGTLGTLAEELSGYSRRKGGFTFRFGR